MNVDKNFLYEHIALREASQLLLPPFEANKQAQNTRTHQTQNNLNEYVEGRHGTGVKTLSLPRQATDDDETAIATATTTMMITDSSDDCGASQ